MGKFRNGELTIDSVAKPMVFSNDSIPINLRSTLHYNG